MDFKNAIPRFESEVFTFNDLNIMKIHPAEFRLLSKNGYSDLVYKDNLRLFVKALLNWRVFQDVIKFKSKCLGDRPLRPYYGTFEVYESYLNEQNAYNLEFDSLYEFESLTKIIITKIEGKIIEFLPAHFWFDIGGMYVALQLSDWPGDKGKIIVEQKGVVLPVLKKRIIN